MNTPIFDRPGLLFRRAAKGRFVKRSYHTKENVRGVYFFVKIHFLKNLIYIFNETILLLKVTGGFDYTRELKRKFNFFPFSG